MSITDSSGRLGSTALLGKGLTPGKLRGLQRISNPNGTLTMLALDQNSSVIEMAINALASVGENRRPTYNEIVEAKLDLTRYLASAASGVLLDAYYGAWSAIASEAIPPDTGLLVRYEMSGSPKNQVGAPMAAVEPGWSVEKIKRMGADAVKLLAQFEPTEPISAEHQFQLVEHVYNECRKFDILLLLETVSFPFGGEKKTSPSYLDRKPQTVIEAARQLSRFCDIYKSEFPGTLGRQSDDQLENNLHALDAASERPWVLLSAGVDYAQYLRQVEMAMGVGASGILGGRAFWKEYFLQEAQRRGAGSPRPPGGNGWPRSMPWSGAGNSLVCPLRFQQGRTGHRPGRRRLARTVRPGRLCRAGRRQCGDRSGRGLLSLCRKPQCTGSGVGSLARESLAFAVAVRHAERILASLGRFGVGVWRSHERRTGSGPLVDHRDDVGPDHVGSAGLGIHPHGVGPHRRALLTRAHLLHDLDQVALQTISVD